MGNALRATHVRPLAKQAFREPCFCSPASPCDTLVRPFLLFASGARILARSAANVCAAVIVLSLACLPSAANASEALWAASARNDAKAIQSALASGAPVDARDRRGRTALLIATQANAIAAARVLIAAGADVNAKDDIEDSAYLLAGARGHIEILTLTLANGADLRSVNRFGGTALIPAAHYGHVRAVDILLRAGVAPDHVNRLGWTALLEAIILGDGGERHREIVGLLIAAGANVNIADGKGVSPLAHARARGQGEIARMLERAGAR